MVQVSGETIATLCTSHPPSPQRPDGGYLSCNTSHPPSLGFTRPCGAFAGIFPGSCSCVGIYRCLRAIVQLFPFLSGDQKARISSTGGLSSRRTIGFRFLVTSRHFGKHTSWVSDLPKSWEILAQEQQRRGAECRILKVGSGCIPAPPPAVTCGTPHTIGAFSASS